MESLVFILLSYQLSLFYLTAQIDKLSALDLCIVIYINNHTHLPYLIIYKYS